MKVDLSQLEHIGRSVVHCSTEEQAKMFMAAMWEQYPSKVSGIWGKDQTNWDRHVGKGYGIYYLPRIVLNKGEIEYCQSTNLSRHDMDKLVVVEFSDLVRGFDLGEFSSAESDIKSLFGMG